MKPGQIITVDWRDALRASGEPNKKRPAIVVGSSQFFGSSLPFEIVVPLTGNSDLAIPGGSTVIEPTIENGCTKRCYALAWNVQTVPHACVAETESLVSDDVLRRIRRQIADCVDA